MVGSLVIPEEIVSNLQITKEGNISIFWSFWKEYCEVNGTEKSFQDIPSIINDEIESGDFMPVLKFLDEALKRCHFGRAPEFESFGRDIPLWAYDLILSFFHLENEEVFIKMKTQMNLLYSLMELFKISSFKGWYEFEEQVCMGYKESQTLSNIKGHHMVSFF